MIWLLALNQFNTWTSVSLHEVWVVTLTIVKPVESIPVIPVSGGALAVINTVVLNLPNGGAQRS